MHSLVYVYMKRCVSQESVLLDGDKLYLANEDAPDGRVSRMCHGGFDVEQIKIEAMEHIRTPKVENVRLLDRFNSRKPSVGTLYLTATHLIFVDPAGKKETWIMHMHIAAVEKMPLTTAGSPLQIRCKNFQAATFVIPRERECHDIYTSLCKLSKPVEMQDLYAFHYNAPNLQISKSLGWDLFDIETDFSRMGLPNDTWSLTSINKDYDICDTYPRKLYVPSSVSTHMLVGSSKFRSRGRLPALSYLHRDNGAAILRCSQPLAGFSARCMEDEQLLQAVVKANPNSNFVYIVDTRPKINAMANRAAGKGYESTDFYTNIKFQFLGIENIHVMRSSLQKLIEDGLEASGWLKHIKAILDTSVFIAKAIAKESTSVVVHCSDGWDRTAQTCSLACMMLDPYYRTLHGFQALIEKEWLAFGHKFTDRCGFLDIDPREVSPVFTQFLDSVWQLTQQYPCAFQFNERFLLTLHDHVYSCQFGTFLGNCEKERVDNKLPSRTYSLWGYMQTRMTDYVNPLYRKDHPITKGLMIPNTSPQCFKFWRGMYNRFDNGIHPRESLQDVLSAMKDHSTSLEDHVTFLEKKITSLKKLLGKSDEKIDISKENGSTNDVDSLVNSVKKAEICDGDLVNDNSERDSAIESSGEETSSNSDSAINRMAGADTYVELTSAQLEEAIESVALTWKTIRNVRQCSCASPFDHFSRRYHCWKCGEVFCTRCIDKQTPLPGHYSQSPVSVCRPCYKEVKHGQTSGTPTPTD
ncbi:phosphatidylinositol-3,5-bisphosphate 3-phosphatase MTMR6-like isoform X2 [Ptychodera flava]|uniref:phosphatidylinositol-3,5-bisphosphate 3-phosphatase MTMR6-like isoform X2 n=1 Tax=Ptychodera flava TaxID=63121 RepID=UPI003969D171